MTLGELRYQVLVWLPNEDAPVVVADNLSAAAARVALVEARSCWPLALVDLKAVP